MRAQFQPVGNVPGRPRWSVMIPTYNSTAFLRTTLESVLAQDPGEELMQIEVVDDASSDDPSAIVQTVAGGRVGVFRQETNRGQLENLATCIDRSTGEIVHLLHGDDYVLPGFYDALWQGFAADDAIGAAFCRWTIVGPDGESLSVAEPEQDQAGRLPDALERLASEQRIVTPSIAVRRSAWEQLGGFDSRLRCAEDWEMWVRIAAHFPVWYEPRILAAYRRHPQSTTARNTPNAVELRYSRLAMRLFAPLLPPARAAAVLRRARRAYAKTALANAASFSSQGEWRAMWANLVMAGKLDPSWRTVRGAARAILRGSAK